MKKPDSVRFTLTVTITQPIDLCGDDRPADYIDKESQRRIEKAVIHALRTLDGDADCECVETDFLDADGEVMSEPEPVDEEYERLASRDRLNNFDRTGGKDWT
jgi:hypothetical protein